MEEQQSPVLASNIEDVTTKRRRDLLPWWIKTFTWMFLVFGAIAPVAFILGLFGLQFQLSLYGLETFQPMSPIGLSLIAIFMFKGIIAWGLLMEEDWAIKLGQIDSIIGIVICTFMMLVYPFIDSQPGFYLNLRLELVLLILFLKKLGKIKDDWMGICATKAADISGTVRPK